MSSSKPSFGSHDTLELHRDSHDESDCASHSSDSDVGNFEASTHKQSTLELSQPTSSEDALIQAPADNNESTPTNYPSNQQPEATTTNRFIPTVGESTAILSEVCCELSKATSPEMVELANNPGPQRSLTQDLLPLYFYSWELKSPIAVLVNLLLHCFVYQRDILELREGRRAFEDHIQGLKEKIACYETELKEMKLRNGLRPCTASGQVELCYHGDEVERLQNEMAALRDENLRLQSSYDEVCHINHQWALDYESLQQQISSTKLTGFSSLSNSSQVGGATSNMGGASSQYHGILMSPSSEQHHGRCFECHTLASRLKDTHRENDSLKSELKKVTKINRRLEEERDQAVHENKAIQYQLQELGDLHQAMVVKEDYSRMQQEIKQLKKQYRDAVCARMKLDKQVDRLRQVFIQLFPFTAASNTAPYPTGGRGYASYPAHLRPCRVQQQYYSDPGPPTPPGLIARGNKLTSLVEKDIKALSMPHSREEQVIGFERPVIQLDNYREAPPHSWHGLQSDSQERSASAPLIAMAPHKDPSSQLVNGHGQLNSQHVSTASHVSLAPPTKHTLVPMRTQSLRKTRPRSLFDDRTSGVRSERSGAGDPTYLVRSLVDCEGRNLYRDTSPEGPPTSITTHHLTQNSYTDTSTSTSHTHPMSVGHTHSTATPRSGNYSSNLTSSSLEHVYKQRLSQDSALGSQFEDSSTSSREDVVSANPPRSTAGNKIDISGVAATVPDPGGQRRTPGGLMVWEDVSCPSCSKVFSRSNEGFDRWFDHVRFCGT